MKKKMTIAVVLLVLLFGFIFGTLYGVQSLLKTGLANYTPPPVAVSAEPAAIEAWDVYLKSVGTLSAANGVEITSEVGGLVKEIHFASGIDVKQGQVLLQLDDSVEQANLRSYSAQLKLARINYSRDKKLLASRAISKTDFDTVEAKLKDAEAQLERTKALIEQKQIHAPFTGRLGIRQVNVGDFVSTGDQLVTLQALDIMHINFSVPEQYSPRLFQGQLIRFTVQAFDDQVFEARISAINAKVDQNTRNLQVRATINNDNKDLLPGMFANVKVVLDQKIKVITVPQTAVSYSLYGDSIFVVKNNKDEQGNNIQLVDRRFIKVDQRRFKRVSVAEGVTEGDMVVTAGQLKLKNGAHVLVDNTVKF